MQDQWHSLRRALDALMDLDPARQLAWLEANTAHDPELRRELQSLLELNAEPATRRFLEAKIPASLVEPRVGDLAGQRTGHYVLDSLIGEGGMGTVWRASRDDGHFQGQVAIKLLNTALRAPEAAHRFMREGRLLAKLSHPNIARLLDAGVDPQGTPFLVLEHIDGQAIDRHCDACRLGVRERVRLFLGVLAAVEHSHSHLVVHRDIKPSNVLVTADGTPKLLDFGIARLADVDPGTESAAGVRTRTLWNGRAMTLQFAAPEQLRGQAATTRSDIYGLGVLLYLLLTGRHPAGLDDPASTACIAPTLEGRLLRAPDAARAGSLEERAARAGARGTTPEKLRAQLAGDLDRILAKALKLDPDERFGSAGEFAQDLRRYLEHRPVLARGDSAWYRAGKFVRRHRFGTAASVVALGIIATMGAAALQKAREARFEAERAALVNAFVRNMFGLDGTSTERVDLRTTNVEQLLDAGTRRLQADTTRSPEARADLLGTLADMYVSLGQPAKAVVLLEQKLDIARGPVRVADTLVSLARAAGLAGQAEKRLAALERAAPLVRELQDREPLVFGHWAYQRAASLNPVDPLAAAALAREAAEAFGRAGDRVEQARALLHQAFALSRVPLVEQARPVALEAERVARAIEPRHKEIMFSVLALRADLAFESLRLQEAEALARAGLDAVIDAKGALHPMTSRAHMRVALALQRGGDLAGCIREASRAVEAVEGSSGPADQRVLPQALQVLGPCQAAYGELDASLASLERAVRLWNPSANGGLMLAGTYEDLALVHILHGDLEAAEKAYASAIAAMDARAAQRKAPRMAMILAHLRLAQGRATEAVAVLEPLAARLDETAPGWERADLELSWVRALTAARDPRAPVALRAARTFLAESPLKNHAPLLEADLLLSEAEQLEAVNPALAARQRAAALAIYTPRLGPMSPLLASARTPRNSQGPGPAPDHSAANQPPLLPATAGIDHVRSDGRRQ